MQKYDLEIINTETTIYDDTMHLAGTYDALFRETSSGQLIVVDWKSGKYVYESYKYQLSFYGKNTTARMGYIVRPSDNKRGYSVTKVDVKQYYDKLKSLCDTK